MAVPFAAAEQPGERQKAAEKWGEDFTKAWREFEDKLRKQTLDTPGNPEEEE